MDVPEILSQLARTRHAFPLEAVNEALARREEITPALLDILQRAAADPGAFLESDADRDDMGLTFALYLLAKFREPRACPLALQLAAAPEDTLDGLLGDVVNQDLGRILASVCGGSTDGIKALIENEKASEWSRAAGVGAIVALVAAGELDREEALRYFASLFHRLEREPSYIWSALVCACADLCPVGVVEEIRQAYRDGVVDPGDIGMKDVRAALKAGPEEALKDLTRGRRTLVDDIEDEMNWMSGFQPEPLRLEPDATDDRRPDLAPFLPPLRDVFDEPDVWDDGYMEPYVRPEPKIGRNNPCPCGSGKKYKKCCGK
jgi:hypothetical protein